MMAKIPWVAFRPFSLALPHSATALKEGTVTSDTMKPYLSVRLGCTNLAGESETWRNGRIPRDMTD